MLQNTYGAEGRAVLRAGAVQEVRVLYWNEDTSTFETIQQADIAQGSFSLLNESASTDVELGSAIASELKLTVNDPTGVYKEIPFEGKQILAELLWDVPGHTIKDMLILFTGRVDSVTRARTTVEIVALDSLVRLDAIHDPTRFQWGTTGLTVYDIAEICVTSDPTLTLVDNASAVNKSVVIIPSDGESPFPADATYRQVLMWCCEIMGCCARARNNGGAIELVWYTPIDGTEVNLPPSDRYASTVSAETVTTTGVAISLDEETRVYGAEGYTYEIEGNPLITAANADTIGSALANRLVGESYRPFTATVRNMPYLQPFDVMAFVDVDDPTLIYPVRITSTKIGCNVGVELVGAGETEAQKGYASLGGLTKSQSATLRKVQTELRADATEKASAVESGLLNLNEMLTLGLGLHQIEYPTGSGKYYFADAATLDAATYIFTINSNGWAYTNDWNDGSPVWNGGVTRDGNAIFRYLYANKIVADMINTGSISSNNGTMQINLDSNTISFVDGNQNKCVISPFGNTFSSPLAMYNPSVANAAVNMLGLSAIPAPGATGLTAALAAAQEIGYVMIGNSSAIVSMGNEVVIRGTSVYLSYDDALAERNGFELSGLKDWDAVTSYHVASQTGEWSWRKYASGACELHGVFTVRATSSTADSPLYYSDQLQIGLPFEVTDGVLTGTAHNLQWIANPAFVAGTTPKVGFRLVRGKAINTTDDQTVWLTIHGKYTGGD